MQKELDEIKHFILNAPLPEIRHGIAKLIDYINNQNTNKKVVTPKGKSREE